MIEVYREEYHVVIGTFRAGKIISWMLGECSQACPYERLHPRTRVYEIVHINVELLYGGSNRFLRHDFKLRRYGRDKSTYNEVMVCSDEVLEHKSLQRR